MGIIDSNEIQLCRHCIGYAARAGASALRVSLSKSIQNSICVLDGNIDRITYSEDRSIFLHVFAGGKYGTFSTNRLGVEELESFISRAVDTVLMMEPDKCRVLPDPSHKAAGCTRGDELDLEDKGYSDVAQDTKIRIALENSAAGEFHAEKDGFTVESAECEYSDSCDDNYMIDSEGFEGRHTETSFGFCAEVTVADKQGNRYSGYQWTAAPKLVDFRPQDITAQAIKDAAACIGPRSIESGKKTIVVHAKAASRLVGPVIQALDCNSIQQKFSFLSGSKGRRVFSEKLNLFDRGTARGRSGSRLFDTEGSAVKDGPIIENGIVRQYFVNSYNAAKTGMEATVEGPSRPCIDSFICNSDEKEINLTDILADCGSGILITGFNGGNCDQTTGNFSFGIEGFVFENGQVLYPIEEALMTGNMMDLWNRLRAAGSDAKECARWQIPSLAFDDVEINA